MKIIDCVNYLSIPILPPPERRYYPLTIKISAIALVIFTLGIFFIASWAYSAYKQYEIKNIETRHNAFNVRFKNSAARNRQLHINYLEEDTSQTNGKSLFDKEFALSEARRNRALNENNK